MKPRETIVNFFQDEIMPHLINDNFIFIKSKLKIKRTINDFEQTINIHLDKYNREGESVVFWLMVSITSKIYIDWHKINFDREPLNKFVGGFEEVDIDWEYPISAQKFDINNYWKKPDIILLFKKNFLKKLLPELEKSLDWNYIAKNHWLKKNHYYEKACDLFLIANNNTYAKQAVEIGLNDRALGNHPWLWNKEELIVRKSKFFS